ncbi:MAG TPA: neuraminidase [Cystobacter sp.]
MPERDWERLGELAGGLKASAVGVGPEGLGLLGGVEEPAEGGLLERMKARRARLLRVAAGNLTSVWEGAGWVQALECSGPVGAAIIATLRASGTGSDYQLLVSVDGGREWRARGPVGVPTLSQVLAVSEREFWVLGAGFLGRTADGGATWTEVRLGGERQPRTERLRRVEGGVALLGQGVSLSPDGGQTWSPREVGASRVVDVDGAFVAALVEGQARVGERQDSGVRWGEPLPAGREPVRLVATEGVLRVLTRGVDPARGVEPALHVSEDGGQTWSHHPLPLGLRVDISGREWGLGVDAGGVLLGRLA